MSADALAAVSGDEPDEQRSDHRHRDHEWPEGVVGRRGRSERQAAEEEQVGHEVDQAQQHQRDDRTERPDHDRHGADEHQAPIGDEVAQMRRSFAQPRFGDGGHASSAGVPPMVASAWMSPSAAARSSARWLPDSRSSARRPFAVGSTITYRRSSPDRRLRTSPLDSARVTSSSTEWVRSWSRSASSVTVGGPSGAPAAARSS